MDCAFLADCREKIWRSWQKGARQESQDCGKTVLLSAEGKSK
jgi:hypothetical protein